MVIKNQAGVVDSEKWLSDNDHGRYGDRDHGKAVENRVTRPITEAYYDAMIIGDSCPCCMSHLQFTYGPSGGSYYQCEDHGYQCYYIGWRPLDSRGEEKIIL